MAMKSYTHYNTKKISNIRALMTNKNYKRAWQLIDEYLSEYPNDNMAYLLKARCLIKLDKPREGYDLAVEYYNQKNFHDKKSFIQATSFFCEIMKDIGQFDKACSACVNVIDQYDSMNPDCDLTKLVNSYLVILMNNSKYYSVLDFLKNHPQYDTDDIKVKKAHALSLVDRPYEAFKVLSSVKTSDSDKLHKNFVYGIAYYKLATIRTQGSGTKYNYRLLKKSEDYLLRALKQKDYYYYLSCYILSVIYKRLGLLDKAIEYAEYTYNYANYLQLNEYKIDEIKTLQFDTLLLIGDLDKCEKIANSITNKYMRIRNLIRYYYAIGEYRKVIEIADDILEHGYRDESNIADFKIIVFNKICSHMRLEEYEIAKEWIEKEKDLLDANAAINDLVDLAFDDDQNGSYGFIATKSVNYNRHDVYNRISYKTKKGNSLTFSDRDEIRKAVKYVEENIEGKPCIHLGVLDEYQFDTSEFGKVDGDKGNTLVASTIANTYKVINVYPLVRPYRDKEEEKEVKVQRLSQIEKFNKRYGNK